MQPKFQGAATPAPRFHLVYRKISAMTPPDPTTLQTIANLEEEIRKEKLAIASEVPSVGSFSPGIANQPASHQDRLKQLEASLAEIRSQTPAEE
jgi:hypothetical protein